MPFNTRYDSHSVYFEKNNYLFLAIIEEKCHVLTISENMCTFFVNKFTQKGSLQIF